MVFWGSGAAGRLFPKIYTCVRAGEFIETAAPLPRRHKMLILNKSTFLVRYFPLSTRGRPTGDPRKTPDKATTEEILTIVLFLSVPVLSGVSVGVRAPRYLPAP